MDVQRIAFQDIPVAASNHLTLDYIAGAGNAGEFFTHPPFDFATALAKRQHVPYPRTAIAQRLTAYNTALGAHANALANCQALEDPGTFCVITGQQVGFLGGPAYTPYKIITTLRLAEQLQARLQTRVVPIFWLASEDHDFGEINHVDYIKRDGEIGRIGFPWADEGHPIADLTVSEDVQHAYDAYFSQLPITPYHQALKQQFAPKADEDYCMWNARLWSDLCSEHGLVIVEPHHVRTPAADFFTFALQHADEIQRRLTDVGQRLRAAGYTPALSSPEAGLLYTFDTQGQRVRVKDAQAHLSRAASTPTRYSTDAALRPLLADAMLPVIASVLGPGEIAYQAMLKPLYALFDLPQPILFPRKSYTVVSQRQVTRLHAYQANAHMVLTENLDVDRIFVDALPPSELEKFTTAQQGIEAALAPLKPYLTNIDPSLERTWSRTQYRTLQNLEKLKARAIKARMSQLGLSKGELHALSNALLPRGNLQERVLPLAHFLNQFGPDFIGTIFHTGDLYDFSHHIVVLEDHDA